MVRALADYPEWGGYGLPDAACGTHLFEEAPGERSGFHTPRYEVVDFSIQVATQAAAQVLTHPTPTEIGSRGVRTMIKQPRHLVTYGSLSEELRIRYCRAKYSTSFTNGKVISEADIVH